VITFVNTFFCYHRNVCRSKCNEILKLQRLLRTLPETNVFTPSINNRIRLIIVSIEQKLRKGKVNLLNALCVCVLQRDNPRPRGIEQ